MNETILDQIVQSTGLTKEMAQRVFQQVIPILSNLTKVFRY